MGSEHYCLRWNNHQSNLLGVFSQLLQDESLVDVTLACSEGASIRAHKVVLSACSSYFQTLFLDHPGRHPIVILKDVEYPELRTLVEFMYKGEVNVQYCQLSALLKTAESLKVKGLAEMTNQSTALRETEREQDRLRPHSIPTKSEPLENATSSSAAVAAAAAAAVTSSSSLLSSSTIKLTATNTTATTTATSSSSILTLPPIRQESERSSPTSPPRLQSHSPTPLALYQKKLTNRDREHHLLETRISPHDDSPFIPKEERASSPDDDGMSNDVGLNMSLNSNAIHSAPPSCVIPPPVSSISTDLRPSSRGGLSSICIGNNGNSIRDIVASGSGLPSPMSEPLPGPSGMGPVQQVPLSLKKEIEWDRHDDKMIGSGESSSSDFRHPLDSEVTDPHGGGGGQTPDGGPLYPCMYCGASFPHQSKLTRHILSHSLETLKYRETAHLLHTGHLNLLPHEMSAPNFTLRPGPQLEPLEPPDGQPMDIDYQNSATTLGSSISNSALGSDQGVVLCKFCGKSFPDVSSLITHLPVHTGDRPFKCEFCGKAFKLRHHMKDHCRVHTGERPFRCGMCGKTFSRSTILKAHEKTHFPKYVRKFLSPSPVETKEEPQ